MNELKNDHLSFFKVIVTSLISYVGSVLVYLVKVLGSEVKAA